MEHRYIEEHNIIDRYLLGKLSDEELIGFEEHFIGCSECTGWLKTTERLRIALRTVAAEEATRTRAYVQTGLFVKLVRMSQARPVVWLAGFALLIGLPMVWLTLEWRSARHDLAQVQQTSSELQRKYEEKTRVESGLMNELQTREVQASAQRDQLSAQLEEVRRNSAADIKKDADPQASVPVFTLSVARSGGSDQSQPANRVVLPSSSTPIILLLELQPESNLQSYRAEVSTADGRHLWRKSDLKPGSQDALAFSLNSSLFKPNDYLLTLEGLTAQGKYLPVAKYTFRVLTQPSVN